MVNKNIYKA